MSEIKMTTKLFRKIKIMTKIFIWDSNKKNDKESKRKFRFNTQIYNEISTFKLISKTNKKKW